MTEQKQQRQEGLWGERCSVKLDMALARLDWIESKLYYLKGTFTTAEAAAYLGLAADCLHRQAEKLNIPHTKLPNGRMLFNKEELDRWSKGLAAVPAMAMGSPVADDITVAGIVTQESYY